MHYHEIHKIARRKVRHKKWFNRHLAFFVSVFAVIVLTTLPNGNWWYVYRSMADSPFFVWCALLLLHYLLVYGFPITGVLSDKWEEKELKKELNKLYAAHPIDEEDYQGHSFEDRLELQELNRLKDKWEPDQFV